MNFYFESTDLVVPEVVLQLIGSLMVPSYLYRDLTTHSDLRKSPKSIDKFKRGCSFVEGYPRQFQFGDRSFANWIRKALNEWASVGEEITRLRNKALTVDISSHPLLVEWRRAPVLTKFMAEKRKPSPAAEIFVNIGWHPPLIFIIVVGQREIKQTPTDWQRETHFLYVIRGWLEEI